MDVRKKLEIMEQIKEANKQHVEEWKEQQPAPCPFCGEPISLIHEGFVDYWRFHCPNCDFSGSFGPGSASVRYGSKEEARKRAIQKWNKRMG